MLSFIDIPRRQNICSKGQEKLTPGTFCYSLLLDTPKGWQRQDFCEKCWSELQATFPYSSVISTWKTQIPKKVSFEALPKHKEERALALLKLAVQRDGSEDREEAFFLALYLMRKKILIVRQETKQFNETILFYEVAATEEIVPVKKIDSATVDHVRVRLAAKLKSNDTT